MPTVLPWMWPSYWTSSMVDGCQKADWPKTGLSAPDSFLSPGDDPDEAILYYGGHGVIEDEGEVIFINKLSGPDRKSFRLPIGKYQEIKEGYTNHYPELKDVAGRWIGVDENYFK